MGYHEHMGGSCRRAFGFASAGMGLLVGISGACQRGAPVPAGTREFRVQELARVDSTPSPSEQLARRAMFEQLVADIRAYHLFPDAWPEERWAAELPALEREVTGAVDRSALLVALSHVAGSLRDGHLAFTPTGGWTNPGIAVLPVSFFQTGSPLQPRFFINRTTPEAGLAAGDELVQYDGFEVATLLEHFALEIDRASPAARAARLAELLQGRKTETHPGTLGSTVAIRVKRGDAFVDATLVFGPNRPPPDPTSDPPSCPARQRDFGAEYELARASGQLCLYRGVSARTSRYPIVRHTSFFYGSQASIDYAGIEQDHELVRAFLAATPHLAGVLLDLRDNAGGHHSDLFLPWYLSGSYPRTRRWVRLHPQLSDRARLSHALWSSEAAEEYVRRAGAGETWWVAPFECSASECPPMSKALVTKVPIAVLVGPSCRSSCDTFVNVWSERHAGPTIGEPAAAMLTSNRYPLDVRLGDESLGQLTVALSGVRATEHDPWLEGNPGPVDELVEQSWPAADYEQKMIDTAIRAIERAPSSARNSRPRHATLAP
jgi:hypothetical protein